MLVAAIRPVVALSYFKRLLQYSSSRKHIEASPFIIIDEDGGRHDLYGKYRASHRPSKS